MHNHHVSYKVLTILQYLMFCIFVKVPIDFPSGGYSGVDVDR